MSYLSDQVKQFQAEAQRSDAADSIKHLRDEFIFPTLQDLKSKTVLDKASRSNASSERPCLYFCGNSLGLQPKLVQTRISEHLTFWAHKGVHGHFTQPEDTAVKKWTAVDDHAAELVAPIVGAKVEEVAAMDTLTGNLHLALASFYKPSKEKHKIIIESKAFPSDHYAVESHLRHHDLPLSSLITIEPTDPQRPLLTTEQICSTLTEHASTTALVLLPGIQYYTGQLLDIPTITAHAHSLGLLIGWDLAHAVGNVPLSLHDWNADFAVWCHYKYVNAGPGAIGGLFIHESHGKVDRDALARGDLENAYRHRLAGWWGVHTSERFDMKTDLGTSFVPRPGAMGFQVSNPCALALAALQGSLEVFGKTSMEALRAKSLAMTGFTERMLEHYRGEWTRTHPGEEAPFWIITPSDPAARGAQLSVRMRMGLLDGVMAILEENGVVLDERKPDVLRVAPAPLYNTFEECWRFCWMLSEICVKVLDGGYKLDLGLVQPGGEPAVNGTGNGISNGANGKSGSKMVQGGKEEKGAWEEIK